MKKVMMKLKQNIRKWLGFGEMFMGIDVNIKAQSQIIIVSRLNGGQIRIIDVHFDSLSEMEKIVEYFKNHYGITSQSIVVDMPFRLRSKEELL